MSSQRVYDQLYSTSTVFAEPEGPLCYSFVGCDDKSILPHAWSVDYDGSMVSGIMPPLAEDFGGHSQVPSWSGSPSDANSILTGSLGIGLGLDFGLTSETWPSPFLSLDSYSVMSSRAEHAGEGKAMPPLCVSPSDLVTLSHSQAVALSFEQLCLSEPASGPSRVGGPTIPRSYSASSRAGPSLCSDGDAEGETDDNSDSGFCPSPSTTARKRRYSPYAVGERPKRVASRIGTLPSPVPSCPSPARTGGRTRPRNAQANVLPEQVEQALRDGSCTMCGFVPASRRVPDLRRHMDTHRADVNHEKWVCCGVPLKEASAYGIRVEDPREAYVYRGHAMVGGCRQSFSRRDALTRHVKNDRIGCCGSADLAEKFSEL